MKKKVAIIDDEAAGRQLLREYLSDYPDFVIVGEANNGVDAVRLINKFQPDLLFLDIQMPGMTGFEVLTELDEIPQVIFSTAYDQYALRAFEVHAVDYLLKPYTKSRFGDALSRVQAQPQQENLQALTESVLQEQPNRYPERILVQHQRKLINLRVADIIRVEAFGDYSKLITDEQTFVSNFGIGALEEKLNPEHIVRVHRSAMINLNAVREVEKYTNSYDVIMQNGDVVRVSRGYMDNLKRIMF